MAPQVLQNCSWIKVTFISEKKYLPDREIQLGDGGEGKRKAKLVKLSQNAASMKDPNLDFVVVVRGNWVSLSSLTH